MAAARPQQLHPGHAAAAPARHHPPHRRSVCRRDRGPAGADPVLTAGRAGHRRAGHHGADGAGAEHPHPDALFYRPLLVDGQRRGAYVQLDELVHPECSAHGLSAAHHTVRAESRCQTGCIQSGLLFEGLWHGRLLQRRSPVLPPRRADPVGVSGDLICHRAGGLPPAIQRSKDQKYCGVHLQCPCGRALLPELWRLQPPCRAVRCTRIPLWTGCGQRCFASPCGGRLPRRCRPRPFAEPGRQHPHQPVVPSDHRLCRRRNDGVLRSAPAPFNSVVPQRGRLCRAAGQLGAGCKVWLQRRQPQPQRYRQYHGIQGQQTVPHRYRSGELHPKDLQPPAV